MLEKDPGRVDRCREQAELLLAARLAQLGLPALTTGLTPHQLTRHADRLR